MSYDEEPKLEPESGDKKEGEESFSFLQETIKPKPITRKKILTELARIGIYGVVFGMFACFGFFALKPWVQTTFQGDPKTVTIPTDEETEQEQQEQVPAEEAVPPALNADSLKEITKSLLDIGKEAGKSIVSVQTVRDDGIVGAEAGVDSIVKTVTGLVVGDNGQALLVLCDSSICGTGDKWNVTFSDGSVYGASLKKQDKNSGLAVLAIQRDKIADGTWNATKVAVLGNSNIVSKGDIVIALGNTFGYTDGIGYGIISSNGHEESLADSQRGVLATDIAHEEGGTGVLFNLSGEVVGLIDPNIWEGKQNNTAKALEISDLKATIELLVNGESVPYVGIFGTTINDSIAEAQSMPTGVYVMEVKPDSPAMAAGIQSGDIIREVSGTKVSSTLAYEKAILNSRVGEGAKIKGQRRGANGYVDIEFTVTIGSQE